MSLPVQSEACRDGEHEACKGYEWLTPCIALYCKCTCHRRGVRGVQAAAGRRAAGASCGCGDAPVGWGG